MPLPTSVPGPRFEVSCRFSRESACTAGRCVGASEPVVAWWRRAACPRAWAARSAKGAFCPGGCPDAPRPLASSFCPSRSPRGTGCTTLYLHSVPASARREPLGLPCILLVALFCDDPLDKPDASMLTRIPWRAPGAWGFHGVGCVCTFPACVLISRHQPGCSTAAVHFNSFYVAWTECLPQFAKVCEMRGPFFRGLAFIGPGRGCRGGIITSLNGGTGPGGGRFSLSNACCVWGGCGT